MPIEGFRVQGTPEDTLKVWARQLNWLFKNLDTVNVTIGTDDIKDYMIDFGTGLQQVDASDVPIVDSAGYYSSTNVEGALAEAGNPSTKVPYAVDAQGTDDYAVTIAGVASYVAGLPINFKANTANTGACTLNVNSLGAKSIKKEATQDLSTGDIEAGQIVPVVYDGTNFQVVGGGGGGLSSPLTADLNFAGYKAVAMACDNGTSFPSTPSTGQWFYRTDIDTLFIYEAAWKAIISFGSVTLYVNATSGSDAVGQGYSSGTGATATIQYAVNLLPPINGGNVIINITGETYREMVTVQGKAFSGPYTITLLGTLTNITSGTASAGAASTLTTTLNRTLNQDQGRLLRITGGTGSGQNRVILSNTAGPNTIYTVERFATNPDATSTFSVDDWATRVTGSDAGADTTAVRANAIYINENQKNVNIESILGNYTTGTIFYYRNSSSGTATNCKGHNGNIGLQAVTGSAAIGASCYFYANSYGTFCNGFSTMTLNDCWLLSNTSRGAQVQQIAQLVYGRCTIESNTGDGIRVNGNSALSVFPTANTIKNNGGWGIFAELGGFGGASSANTYSGNASGTYTPTTATVGGNS